MDVPDTVPYITLFFGAEEFNIIENNAALVQTMLRTAKHFSIGLTFERFHRISTPQQKATYHQEFEDRRENHHKSTTSID